MMFRKLYWVSETVAADLSSNVLGVYTSIHDLIDRGLRPRSGESLRLTLTKLDSSKEPFGVWSDAHPDELVPGLQPFVETEEFTTESVLSLVKALEDLRAVAA
ncbi:hypothetical protein EON81_23250 [bacterium]|nr:MAG: hypothetical protein EON81_23250 [bacterium]